MCPSHGEVSSLPNSPVLVKHQNGIMVARAESMSIRTLRVSNLERFREGLYVTVIFADGMERRGVIRRSGNENAQVEILSPL